MQNQTAIDKKKKLEKLKALRANKLHPEAAKKTERKPHKQSEDGDSEVRESESEPESENQAGQDFLQQVVESINAKQRGAKLSMIVQDDGDEPELPQGKIERPTKVKATGSDKMEANQRKKHHENGGQKHTQMELEEAEEYVAQEMDEEPVIKQKKRIQHEYSKFTISLGFPDSLIQKCQVRLF